MIELYQAEWCPYSRLVRQRLTELGLDFVARQVPAEREDRHDLERLSGTNEIPVLVLDDGEMLTGDAKEIVAHLDARFDEGPEAEAHRPQARPA